MWNVKCPCQGCGNRHDGCHDDCDPYLAYKAEVAAMKERREEAVRWSKPNMIPRKTKK